MDVGPPVPVEAMRLGLRAEQGRLTVDELRDDPPSWATDGDRGWLDEAVHRRAAMERHPDYRFLVLVAGAANRTMDAMFDTNSLTVAVRAAVDARHDAGSVARAAVEREQAAARTVSRCQAMRDTAAAADAADAAAARLAEQRRLYDTFLGAVDDAALDAMRIAEAVVATVGQKPVLRTWLEHIGIFAGGRFNSMLLVLSGGHAEMWASDEDRLAGHAVDAAYLMSDPDAMPGMLSTFGRDADADASLNAILNVVCAAAGRPRSASLATRRWSLPADITAQATPDQLAQQVRGRLRTDQYETMRAYLLRFVEDGFRCEDAEFAVWLHAHMTAADVRVAVYVCVVMSFQAFVMHTLRAIADAALFGPPMSRAAPFAPRDIATHLRTYREACEAALREAAAGVAATGDVLADSGAALDALRARAATERARLDAFKHAAEADVERGQPPAAVRRALLRPENSGVLEVAPVVLSAVALAMAKLRAVLPAHYGRATEELLQRAPQTRALFAAFVARFMQRNADSAPVSYTHDRSRERAIADQADQLRDLARFAVENGRIVEVGPGWTRANTARGPYAQPDLGAAMMRGLRRR